MTRRPGLSLTEVLVALGITSIGMLAVMSLYPVGAAQVGIAVREDRSAQAAAIATGHMRTVWKTRVVERPGAEESFFAALDDPDGSGSTWPAAGSDEASYPVVVDPMGWVARNSISQSRMGDYANMSFVPRRTLDGIGGNNSLALRACSLLDTCAYDADGNPTSERELRYNFMWVVQRPSNRNRYQANLTVVVFDKRPHLFAPAGSEAVYSARFTPNSTLVSVSWTSGGAPDIKVGGWVMDGTVSGQVRHANLYKVARAELTGSTTMEVELQTPVKPSTNQSNPNAAYDGTLLVIPGISGVYPRQPLTAD